MRTGKLILLAVGLCALGCGSDDDGDGDGGGGSNNGGSSGSSGATNNGGASGGTANGGNGGATGGTNNSGGNAGSGGDGETGGSSGDGGTDGEGGSAGADGGSEVSMVNFFITSTGSATGNLGGLEGADFKCAALAEAAGYGDKIWHAYLSIENGPGGQPVHAKDRIGGGPWYNVYGEALASDLTELHALAGDYLLFLDENGNPVPGRWEGSPTPNKHDLLTGSNRDGTVNPGYTCNDWTSESADETAWVGHTDGLGPNGTEDAWNAVHENGGCNDTAPRGGDGRIACFGVIITN